MGVSAVVPLYNFLNGGGNAFVCGHDSAGWVGKTLVIGSIPHSISNKLLGLNYVLYLLVVGVTIDVGTEECALRELCRWSQ